MGKRKEFDPSTALDFQHRPTFSDLRCAYDFCRIPEEEVYNADGLMFHDEACRKRLLMFKRELELAREVQSRLNKVARLLWDEGYVSTDILFS